MPTTKIRLLTHNLWMIHSLKSQPPFRTERANAFLKHLSSEIPIFDIVCLQEAFKIGNIGSLLGFDNSPAEIIIAGASKLDYFIVEPPEPWLWQQNSGLLILSKLPIIYSWFHTFTQASFNDSFLSKGCLFACIKLSELEYLHVLNCHLESHEMEIQVEQLVEMRELMERIIGDSKSRFKKQPTAQHYFVLVGDFNIDSLQSKFQYQHMMREFAHLEDMFATSLQPHPITYLEENTCLDRILVPKDLASKWIKEWQLIKWKCVLEGKSWYISDHHGVAATLHFEK